MESAPAVTVETLLHGSWSALEHAGRLLDRAVTLFEAGEWSAATDGAMSGEAQFRQHRILRSLADDVADGRCLAAVDAEEACTTRQDTSTIGTHGSPTPD